MWHLTACKISVSLLFLKWNDFLLYLWINVETSIQKYDKKSFHFDPVQLTVLGFNDISTFVGHFVLSPREREKRDRRSSVGYETEGQERKRNRNKSEETEEIKHFPSTLTCYKDSRPCSTVSQYQLDTPVT